MTADRARALMERFAEIWRRPVTVEGTGDHVRDVEDLDELLRDIEAYLDEEHVREARR